MRFNVDVLRRVGFYGGERGPSRCSTPMAGRNGLRLTDRLPREQSDVTVHRRIIDSDEEAERVRFLGSPTILIDGVDPWAHEDAPIGTRAAPRPECSVGSRETATAPDRD